MLVATRDPMHEPGAPDPSSHRHERIYTGAHPAPKTARMMSFLQLAGSFLAIPVALGSAYSVYQTNFSPDTQCQTLRANIIAMIDKKIDATTRRMLVRRDVETFEKSCGAFDPDAKAAFVTLLQNEPRVVPPRPVAAAPKVEAAKAEQAKPEPVKAEAPKAGTAKAEPAKSEAVKSEAVKSEAAKAETPAKDVARKPEARPVAPVARQVAAVPPAEAAEENAVHDDARWLDAVRGALVSHEAARETAVTRAPAEQPLAKTAPQPAAVAAPMTVAPALPPATAITEAAAPQAERSDPDRPVPPGSIPDAPADGGARSTWVSKIPFVGQVLDK
jgi:hypothetical protein